MNWFRRIMETSLGCLIFRFHHDDCDCACPCHIEGIWA